MEKKDRDITKPSLPLSIPEVFVNSSDSNLQKIYTPRILGVAKLHFVEAKKKIDLWQDVYWIASLDDDGKSVLWQEGEDYLPLKSNAKATPIASIPFSEVPKGLLQEKNYPSFHKELAAYLYQNQTMELFLCSEFNLNSKEGESQADFKTRVIALQTERREEAVAKLKAKYAEKRNVLENKMRQAQEKLTKQQHKAGWQKFETFLSFGATLLGAIFGRGVTKGTISQTGTSLRRAGKIGMESQGASQAEENYQECQRQLEALQLEMNNEVTKITAEMDPKNIAIETYSIRPRKSDLSVEKIVVAWVLSS